MKSRLKELRLKNGLTGSELSRLTNVINESQLSRVENPKTKAVLTIEQVKVISNFFGVTSDYLLGLSDDPSPRNPIYYKRVEYSEKVTLTELLEKYSGIEIIINYQQDEIIIIENPLAIDRKIVLFKKI